MQKHKVLIQGLGEARDQKLQNQTGNKIILNFKGNIVLFNETYCPPLKAIKYNGAIFIPLYE